MMITVTNEHGWYSDLVGQELKVYGTFDIMGGEVGYIVEPIVPGTCQPYISGKNSEISGRTFVKILCKNELSIGKGIIAFKKDHFYAAEVLPGGKLRSWGERVTLKEFYIAVSPTEDWASDSEFSSYFTLVE